MLLVRFLASLLLALTIVGAAPTAVAARTIETSKYVAVTTNGVVYVPTPIVDPQKVVVGRDGGRQFFCYASRGFDGKLSVFRDDVSAPLLTEDELPGGQKLSYQGQIFFGCWGNTIVAFFAFHPNLTVGNSPAITLMAKDSGGGLRTLLESGKTAFIAADPKTGADTTFAYTQAYGLDIAGDKMTVFAVVTPPQNPQIPAAPIPQAVFLEIRPDGQPRVIFNNAADATHNTFTAISTYCATSSTLYVTGQSPNVKAGVFRIQGGKATLAMDTLGLFGSQIACGSSGVQVYSLGTESYRYSYIADGSIPEVAFFSGLLVDGLPLSAKDAQFMTGPTELYIATASRALVQISNGQTRLLKQPKQSPVGNATAIAVADGRTLYIQTESRNQSYWMYQPRLSATTLYGQPGDTLRISGFDLVIEGKLPSLSLVIAGKQVVYGADTGGGITFIVPVNAATGKVDGIVDVQGVKLPVAVIIQPAGLPVPVISSASAVVNGASFKPTPLARRSHFTVFFSGATGTEASAGVNASFELGGISAELDGTPVRLVYNSGRGQLNAVVPKTAQGKTSGNLVLKARYPGDIMMVSQPVQVQFTARDDTLFTFSDPGDGTTLPVVVSEKGTVVTKSNPVARGEVFTAYGTGCGLPVDIPDDQNTPFPGLAVTPPAMRIGGVVAQVQYAGLVAGFVGLCQYNVVVPTGIAPGNAVMRLGDDPQGLSYVLPVK